MLNLWLHLTTSHCSIIYEERAAGHGPLPPRGSAKEGERRRNFADARVFARAVLFQQWSELASRGKASRARS